LQINIKNELLIINILSIILILIVSFFPDIRSLRLILGLPLIFFFPGYTLTTAFYPRVSDLNTIERISLSFGLSIAVVALIGLILNYAWEISLYPILTSLVILTAVMSAFSWYKRRGLIHEEKLCLSIDLSFLKLDNSNKLDRVLFSIMIIAIIGAICTLGYYIANPKVDDAFTEFYILGPDGMAEDYPNEIALGEEGEVILGITNHERETMGYNVEILVEGALVNKIGPIELDHGKNWEEMIGFAPQQLGKLQKTEFRLYKIHKLGNQTEGHTQLSLWIGSETLIAKIVNQGQEEVSYQINVTDNRDQATGTQEAGPVTLVSGKEWTQEFEFATFEIVPLQLQFSLYKGETIIYEENIAGDYSKLHLWIDVKKS